MKLTLYKKYCPFIKNLKYSHVSALKEILSFFKDFCLDQWLNATA